MSLPKVVGIEQEYAITIKGGGSPSPFDASCLLVNAFARKAGLRGSKIRILWDYGHETPFQDIRGESWTQKTDQVKPPDENNLLINAALPNGGRLYTDHAHPEYSTPECLSARDVIACDKAGEAILRQALEEVKEILPTCQISLFKNNIDHGGRSYGCHENYLMAAEAHEEYLVRQPHKAVQTLVPFLVTRQIFAGSGKIREELENGLTPLEDQAAPFLISQRASCIETLFGLETTFARPIINTRQEHHADPNRFRRLHLILGDANMSEVAAFLKIGTTQIVLQMMEDHILTEDLALKDPVQALRQVSVRLDALLELANGKKLTAPEIQRHFLEKARQYGERKEHPAIPDLALILEHWESALAGLERLRLSPEWDIEDDPGNLREKLDWVLKLQLISRHRRKTGITWKHPNLKVLDLQYHNINPAEGLFHSLQSRELVQRVLADSEIEHYRNEPPSDTRAYFRGKCIEKFPAEICFVNWEVVAFNHGKIRRMIPLLNPLKGTRQQFEEVFKQAGDSRELINLLKQTHPSG